MDWKWNEMCKNYTKLDQFKRIKSQEIVSQEIEKCYKIEGKKLPMYK